MERDLIQLKRQSPQSNMNDLRKNYSVTLIPGELQRLLDETQLNPGSYLNITAYNTKLDEHDIIDSHQSSTVNDEKADVLFSQFLEILQSHTNNSEVFDVIQDLIHTCVGVLEIIERSDMQYATKKLLKQELKTWKLLYALYKDRILIQQTRDSCMDCETIGLAASEKAIIDHLFSTNSILREYQLIIDWLEACYEKRGKGLLVGHATNASLAWENTLFQLKKRKQVAFGTGVELVRSMDPDAPMREKKPLHVLDEEDNVRLSSAIFEEVRQGRVDEAIALCKYCGQNWRAGILEGWRLYDDSNYDPANNSRVHEKMPIEGNPRRDIWKKCAWLMADNKKFDEFTRAMAGAFCGHLGSLKSLLGNTWDDLLWSYLKVQVDIKVEAEIRTSCMKSYHPMPEAYWNSKMTLDQIFDELAVHNDITVRDYAKTKIATIQKYLILDNITELLQCMTEWVQTIEDSNTILTEPLTPHMLRFFTHIILFMRQIGRIDKEDSADIVISAYVESLISVGDAQLVAFYTASVSTKLQVILYSKFLETLKETSIRALALEQAMNVGLDVENITRHTVEKIRETLPLPNHYHFANLRPADQESMSIKKVKSSPNILAVGEISDCDIQKINALEWLTFIPSQRGELLWHANAMIRTFLAEDKCECVRVVLDIVPSDSITKLMDIYGSKDNVPYVEECSIKEYLSYKVYLTAIDNFNEWSRLFHNKPELPKQLNSEANFTDRIASEHKEQMYRTDLQRWVITLEELAKVCRDSLYNVLVFPDKGWLIDPDTSKTLKGIDTSIWECRQTQIEKLRSICIPEIVLLLYKVLYMSGDYKGCVELADEVASENRQLYKVYTKHKLADFLGKLSESSLELLNKKLDPWGFSATT